MTGQMMAAELDGVLLEVRLARLRAERAAVAVGLAFAEQQVEAVPHDAYDERLDWVVTPAGALRIEG